jgi:hypothetical protein
VGRCVMMEGGAPIEVSDAPGPMIRTCLMPAEHWEIRDTSHALGLKGTGSHDIGLTDVFVPDEELFRVSARSLVRQIPSLASSSMSSCWRMRPPPWGSPLQRRAFVHRRAAGQFKAAFGNAHGG